MINLGKKISTSLTTFAIVTTMGTVATTTAQATCNSSYYCPTYQHCITTSENMVNLYANYPYIKQHWENKLRYWQNKYDTYCVVAPKTGTLCGYVFMDNKAKNTAGVTVTITQANGSTKITSVDSNGKWTISGIEVGRVTVMVDEDQLDANLEDSNLTIRQEFGDNPNTAIVVADKLNEGHVDLYISKIK